MRTVYTAFIFIIFFAGAGIGSVAAQKAHRLTGSTSHNSSNSPAHKLQEIININETPSTRNKAFSLDEEIEEDAYKSEVSISIGAATPCKPFALHTPEGSNVIQGAKTGAAVHANYTIWFIKYFGIGIDFNSNFLGYDFSKTPKFESSENQRNIKTKQMGWSIIALGASLRTKFPIYKNSVYITGRIFAQYGMVNSPFSRAKYQLNVGTAEKPVWRSASILLFAQDMSHNFILGGGVGTRIRVMKRMFALVNFDYSYSTANNSKNKLETNRTGLFSKTYSAITIEAGVAYYF